jgi:hypothetical protein
VIGYVYGIVVVVDWIMVIDSFTGQYSPSSIDPSCETCPQNVVPVVERGKFDSLLKIG